MRDFCPRRSRSLGAMLKAHVVEVEDTEIVRVVAIEINSADCGEIQRTEFCRMLDFGKWDANCIPAGLKKERSDETRLVASWNGVIVDSDRYIERGTRIEDFDGKEFEAFPVLLTRGIFDTRIGADIYMCFE